MDAADGAELQGVGASSCTAARNVFISSNPVIDCIHGASLQIIIKGDLFLAQ